jgi:hypothetical protein
MKVSNEVNSDLKSNASVLVILLILGLLAPHNANAQQANPQAAAIRKNFDDCFYSSVAGQLKFNRTTDYNMVSENAFLACATEEQAIGLLLTANNVPTETVAALLIKIKLDLKKSIRDIAANPSKYLK